MKRVVTVSRLALVMVVAFAAVLTSVAVAPKVASAADEASCLNSAESQFLTLINNYRQSKGLGALKASRALNVASYKHSLDMGKRKYFSHTTKSPLPAGQSGSSPWDRMMDAGYGYNTYKGENIAAGYSSAQSVFNGWKASSGHNKNMLNANFTVIGVGYASVSGSPYKYYWTTDFGGKTDAAPTGC
jgi:uncharacterized protein YkwD